MAMIQELGVRETKRTSDETVMRYYISGVSSWSCSAVVGAVGRSGNSLGYVCDVNDKTSAGCTDKS
jgi:hypothetical protein